MTRLCILLLLSVAAACSAQSESPSSATAASKVELVKTGKGWKLLRNGQPYYIQGAGGAGVEGSLPLLVESGGNSTRTWGVDKRTIPVLDAAHKNGISVTQGLWLEHQADDFDYQNAEQVAKQAKKTMDDVMRLKDHPALLIWSLGNEMEGNGDNEAVWRHIEDLAQRIKKVDPNHPIMTVIAEMGGGKIDSIHKLCPSIDIIGINSYGGAPSVPKRYHKFKGTKPYLIAEFGPLGTWEAGKNDFGAIREMTSTKKARMYDKSYRALKADPDFCLGSYAFLWGWKQEATSTWFAMFTKDGKKSAPVDLMAEFWTGKSPENLCPKIESFKLQGKNKRKPNEVVKINLSASDPEKQTLNVQWVVTDEAGYITGGFKQEEPKKHENCVVSSDESGAEIKLPETEGIVRIYAYVDDGQNACATASLPILVSAKN